MTERVALIAEQIRQLTQEEQADLLDSLLVNRMKNDSIDAAWINETETRLDRFLRGETSARDAKEVLAKHLKP